MKSIRIPNRYITPNLKQGEEAVIHIVKVKSPFVNLKFENTFSGSKYKSIITVDSDIQILIDQSELKAQLSLIEDKIVALDNIYVCYNYLFTIRDNKFFLVSITLEGHALPFNLVKEIAQKIDTLCLIPSWRGIYTNHVLSGFVEDIFIQKA